MNWIDNIIRRIPAPYPWDWIKNFFHRIPAPYPAVSLFLGAILSIIYLDLLNRLFMVGPNNPFYDANFEIYCKIDAFFTSFAVTGLLIGIQYFFKSIERVLKRMRIENVDGNSKCQLYEKFKENFSTSRLYYLILLLVLSPSILIQIKEYILNQNVFFYMVYPTHWAYLFDAYNFFMSYFMLYLLAILILIIINISLIINTLDNEATGIPIKVDLSSADKLGGLRSLKRLIEYLSIYYSFVIIIACLSWITPRGFNLLQTVSLIAFWILGVYFFIFGWYKIRKILIDRIELEVDTINNLYENKRKKIVDLISKSEQEDEKELNYLSNAADTLQKERDRILRSDIKPTDVKTFIIFIASYLISLISITIGILKEWEDLKNIELIRSAINYTQPLINNSINNLLISVHFPK